MLDFIRHNPGPIGKREIARAFRLTADQKVQLKALLPELHDEGTVVHGHGKTMQSPEVPPAAVPRALDEAPTRAVGVFHMTRQGGRVEVADRKARGEIAIETGHHKDAKDGDLVLVELAPGQQRLGLKRGRIKEVIGSADDPRAISLIVIAAKELPLEFPDAALLDADSATIPDLKGREDLRHIPLVTIDGEDARDFDDAVFAQRDGEGWHLLVAIADVAHYVRSGSALDREAYKRGNSVYFPDRVVPMLPEALSNGLCSLKPHEPRACMAFELWIDAHGNLKKHRLIRGLMRSAARLTYNQVQAARNGGPDDTTGPLLQTVIEPLYGAYAALSQARHKRGTLELDIPERRVIIGADGKVSGIVERERLESHKLIEEFMILANVAAAEMAGTARLATLYRVHDRPDAAKLDLVRDFIKDLGYNLPKGQVIKPAQLTHLLGQAAGTAESQLISDIVLRAQAQALYSPDNIGHFGLSLRNYAHFTSPIRRYADLIVHRTLIRLAKLGDDGLADSEMGRLTEIGEHISSTERRAAECERDAIGRYTAAFMASHIGEIFEGRISGVSRFGLFVRLAGNGAEGLIPISTLPDDFYVHEEAKHQLVGRRSGRSFQLAQSVTVKLREADGLTGSTLFSLMGDYGPSRGEARPHGGPPRGGQKRRP